MASSWTVEFERGAEKALGKLDPAIRRKIVVALQRIKPRLK
jgi:mRNA-degrading endonuclease RelE of RelBE toxin-antitoxin system